MEKKVVSKISKVWDVTIREGKSYKHPAITLGDGYKFISVAIADLPALIAALQEIEKETKND